ncbi:unnamed protein product [Penicillium nalgiovense]|uniref:Protein kinase domain-containing protein n=1 Tax=Penicillium nalgiovense TaxID=60175 RepID=A0A9W4HC30_PENNA|nr:unnamed protein product [Penicillium nalgiovense]CAG7970496.1 unnamed protein product [Penicillium nalgiovense]CAG7989034.1 unnamed protein product [Penicillium nalgiovense]CAG7992183.1 unnamed protein product [Penicillium nalgiovense]CAG8026973.1 unnamed protein product [Penicillium nalgiovense]
MLTLVSPQLSPFLQFQKFQGELATMADLQGRKVFKVFNQDFIVSEQYNVTKELGQGAYGIVW